MRIRRATETRKQRERRLRMESESATWEPMRYLPTEKLPLFANPGPDFYPVELINREIDGTILDTKHIPWDAAEFERMADGVEMNVVQTFSRDLRAICLSAFAETFRD
jgi:hypothetical protein